MLLRRIVAAATLATLSLAIATAAAGCTTVVPPIESPPVSQPTTDPGAQQALARAVAALATTSYRVQVTASAGRVVASGSVLPASKSYDIRCATAVEDTALIESVRKIGDTVWLNVDYPDVNAELGITRKQWIAASPTRLSVGTGARFDFASVDPLDISGLLDGVSVVSRNDAGHLTGEMDLARSRGVSAPDADELSEVGRAASTTPFSATLDARGRLLTVRIVSSYSADLDRTVTLDYASAAAPVRPTTASVVPATPTVYELFNQG